MTDQSVPIFIKEYEVSTFLVNSLKRLGLVGLLNMLQDAAGLHANLLGLGYEKMLADNKFWVLTRQRLVMERWPHWRDLVTIKTWPRPIVGMAAVRDFEIYVGRELLGMCTTSWMVLDGQTHKPVRPNLEGTDYPKDHKFKLAIDTLKVEKGAKSKQVDSLRVRSSDLDMNKHVNNTKYAEWVLDAINYQTHHALKLVEYQVNFLAETHLDDEIHIENLLAADPTTNQSEIYQGIRTSDQKVVFRAKLIARQNAN